MLVFAFLPERQLPKHPPTKYPALLQHNGTFSIVIHDEVFFSEPSFPIFEFLLQANEWLLEKNVSKPFEYVSLETDDNPLISFTIGKNNMYHISSPWQIFESNKSFTYKDICQAIELLNHMVC